MTKRSALVWTADVVRDAFTYEPETGHFFQRISRGKSRVGDKAGSLKPTGYVELGFMYSSILAHRAAWLYVHGEMPDGPIDHINQVKTDNRIANLRLVEHSQNVWNCPRQTNARGTYRERSGKFAAKIRHEGRAVYLGVFETETEASAAYHAAAKRMRGEFHAPARQGAEPDGQDLNPDLSASASPATKEQQ